MIETQNLVKIYKEGKVRALDGLNLQIKKGEIYAFIGANGSGKSTAINLINSIIKPTSGKILVNNYEIPKDRNKVCSIIGMAPQEYAIYLDLTVKENIQFFAKNYGMSKDMIKSKLDELLKVLRLEDKENTLCRNLSGGMKRRVSIACALVHNPKIIFFDEATVGVDPILREYFWDYFRTLRNQGSTIVVTSHVMDEAEKADRIGLIRNGILIEEGTPNELKEKYGTKTIEEIFIKLSKEVYVVD
ncbi:MAG: ABC transporter ATP-binding protein [Candidatus Heimdallarchaeota archaeon]|nr:ABC transporter ATP-binding protein [Candidatus Heimdallarchaeota archaeon]MDH5645573.1 ABC transporter ATP-binding protein [Candidatus Heimdallarchaeota archaeon]